MLDAMITPWADTVVTRHLPPASVSDVAGIARLLSVLARALPLLEDAILCSRGRWEALDVTLAIITGQQQLWTADHDGEMEAAAVTSVFQAPRMKVMNVVFLGGTGLKHWAHNEPMFVEWAKANGCSEMEICDTRGGAWGRVLDPGWEPAHMVLRRSV